VQHDAFSKLAKFLTVMLQILSITILSDGPGLPGLGALEAGDPRAPEGAGPCWGLLCRPWWERQLDGGGFGIHWQENSVLVTGRYREPRLQRCTLCSSAVLCILGWFRRSFENQGRSGENQAQGEGWGEQRKPSVGF